MHYLVVIFNLTQNKIADQKWISCFNWSSGKEKSLINEIYRLKVNVFKVSLALLLLSILHWIMHLLINGFQAALTTINNARLVKTRMSTGKYKLIRMDAVTWNVYVNKQHSAENTDTMNSIFNLLLQLYDLSLWIQIIFNVTF